MFILDSTQIKIISGGCDCYKAYQAVADNDSPVTDFIMMFILTPFYTIGTMVGKESAVKAICGNSAAYENAKITYCQHHPDYWECKKK